MTIFQNKDINQYRNIRLSKIKKDGNNDFSDSDDSQGDKKPSDNSKDKKYIQKLEITIENLNGKLSKAKKELEKVKQENLSL